MAVTTATTFFFCEKAQVALEVDVSVLASVVGIALAAPAYAVIPLVRICAGGGG